MKVRKRSPRLTRLEKLTKGLSSDSKKYKSRFSVCEVEGKGRSLFLLKGTVKKDSFVLEYEGELVSHEEAEMRERTYELNKEGCYILFFRFQERRWAIDATRRFKSYARYLNHSRQPNIRFHAPIIVDLNGQNVPRIAAYALRDIHEGEEIVFDYGVRDTDISWLKNTKRSHMSELPSDSSDSEKELEDDGSSDDMELSLRKPGMAPCSTQRQIPKSLTVSPYINHPPAAQPSKKLSAFHAMRFYPRLSSSGMRPSYVVKFENLYEPEKIYRIIEEDSPQNTLHTKNSSKSSQCSRPPSVISLSGSESPVKSSSSCHESESVVVLDCENQLPRNTEPSSMSKVMEWQCQNSSVNNDMQSNIKILNVKSLGASPSDAYLSNSSLQFEVHKSLIPEISEGNMISQQYNPSSIIDPDVSNTAQKISPSNTHPIHLQYSSSSFKSSPTPCTSYEFNKGHLSDRSPYPRGKMLVSDLHRTCKRIKEKGGQIYDLETSESPSTHKPKSNRDSLSDDEEFTILSDTEPTKATLKTEFKSGDEDQIQIILSDSDSDVEVTIVEDKSKQGINQTVQRNYATPPSLQNTGGQTCLEKLLNDSPQSFVSPALQNVKLEDHSKFNFLCSSAEYPVPPSATASSPEIIIDDEPTGDAKNFGVQSCTFSSKTTPSNIMEHKTKLNVGHGSSDSFSPFSSNAPPQQGPSLLRPTLSSSPVAPSHQGPSLLRQNLSSPPVAVIKPFYAHDELDINEEEKSKLREILGPHLFSDNAASQAGIQTAICKNWSFFKTLTDRGVTIDDIRASVRRFVKAAEKERRKKVTEKASHSSGEDNENFIS